MPRNAVVLTCAYVMSSALTSAQPVMERLDRGVAVRTADTTTIPAESRKPPAPPRIRVPK